MSDLVMSRRAFLAFSAALASTTTGCGGNVETSFPPGLTPLAPVTLAVRGATPGNPWPEAISVQSGESDYAWSIGRGFVRAPIARVYEALRDPDVTTDRRRVTRYTVTPNVEPTYPGSYRVRNVVEDIVTVEFDMTWRVGPYAGTNEEPTAYAAVYQKTWGSTFIDMIRGSILATRVDQNVTELQMVRHVKAAQQNESELEQYLLDAFDSVVARVNGRPLPRYT